MPVSTSLLLLLFQVSEDVSRYMTDKYIENNDVCILVSLF